MYKSPVDILYGQMRTSVENDVVRAVMDVGVNVDKEELIRALQYDRGQYEKGYQDAVHGKDLVEVVHSSWILNDDGSGTCKHCHRTTKSVWDCDNWMNYCPNCGADMRERKDNE